MALGLLLAGLPVAVVAAVLITTLFRPCTLEFGVGRIGGYMSTNTLKPPAFPFVLIPFDEGPYRCQSFTFFFPGKTWFVIGGRVKPGARGQWRVTF